mgnify:CR=1 FL=1
MSLMKIIGLMSGTSADGLDIALCDVSNTPDGLKASVIAGAMLPYDDIMRERILLACDPQQSNTPHISALNTDFGVFTGEAIKSFLQEHNATADLIASHGQTIWHEVD